MIIPKKPINPPKRSMENNTQKLLKPVESPSIFGPKILPSNCCNININTIKYKLCIGETIKSKKKLGIAPIKGPKNGITFVTPTITLINIV